jgi:hypothetical protein
MDKKTTWTSPQILNEILKLMATCIVKMIAAEVVKQKYYGLIVDETADVSQVEQLSICLRTADESLSVDEHFVGLYALDSCNGKDIYDAIADVLQRLGISMRMCRGITVDGAGAMQSESVEVVGRWKENVPSVVK